MSTASYTPAIALEMLKHDLVLFAPKSTRGLKVDYPELADKKLYPEFADLSKHEMIFVWAWACKTSPFESLDVDRADKLDLCLSYAYMDREDMHIVKMEEWAKHFPSNIEKAIGKMRAFNLTARIQEMFALQAARNTYLELLSWDLKQKTAAEQTFWYTNSKNAQASLAEQRKMIEGMNLGLEKRSDTLIKGAVDILALYHQQQG